MSLLSSGTLESKRLFVWIVYPVDENTQPCQSYNVSEISARAPLLHIKSPRFDSASAKYFTSVDAHLAGVCYFLAGVGFKCGKYMDCGGTQSIIDCIFEHR
jgi:hypothetical protein